MKTVTHDTHNRMFHIAPKIQILRRLLSITYTIIDSFEVAGVQHDCFQFIKKRGRGQQLI